MSYVRLLGVMLTPVNAPASNVPLRITSQITYGQVVKHSDAIYVCGEDGSYDLKLMYGFYSIEAKFEDSYEFIGSAYIDSNTPNELALNDLFGHLVIPSHPNLEEMRQIQAEVEQDAQDASVNADSAANSAGIAQNSANIAMSAADTATASASAAAQSANVANAASQSVQGDVAAAHADAITAQESANSAATSAAEAAESVSLILGAQINTGNNANSAEQDANSAAGDAASAAASASAALASQQAAAASADSAFTAEQNASISEFSAAASASAASQSEVNANSYSATASAASTTAIQAASAASVSATVSSDNAVLTTQHAASCADDANSADADAITASQAALNAASSETNANSSKIAAATSESNAAASEAAAAISEANAYASEQLAEQYAQALSTGVVAKGPWDASTGYYPPIPDPANIVESYRIDTEGTLRYNGPTNQPQIYVVAGDLIYWGPSDSLWYRVRITDSITGAYILNALAPVDGSGSGLDADLLDGYQGADYGKLSTTRTWTASQDFQGGATGLSYFELKDYPTVITNNNQIANGSGFITGISKSMVVAALGYTPYQESTALSATTGTFSSGVTATTFSASGSITSSGNVTAYSDYRVKTDFEIIPNALDKVTKLTGYTYERTDIHVPRQVGLVAQDVREVLPEAVEEDSEGKLSVAYGNITALLIEAIKELQAKVTELEKNKSV